MFGKIITWDTQIKMFPKQSLIAHIYLLNQHSTNSIKNKCKKEINKIRNSQVWKNFSGRSRNCDRIRKRVVLFRNSTWVEFTSRESDSSQKVNEFNVIIIVPDHIFITSVKIPTCVTKFTYAIAHKSLMHYDVCTRKYIRGRERIRRNVSQVQNEPFPRPFSFIQ